MNQRNHETAHDTGHKAAHDPSELPPQPSAWQLFTAFHSPAQRWPGALRAALALFIPGAVALLLGYGSVMLLIAAGGCVVIYGEGHPFRTRWRVMGVAGLCLIAGATSGSFVGSVVYSEMQAGGSHMWLILTALFTVTLATLGAFVQNALRLPPPGSFFIVMVSGGSTMVARLGYNPVEVGLWASLGVASALVIGMIPALVNPRGPQNNAVRSLEASIAALERSNSSAFAVHHQTQTALTDAWFSLADAGIIRGSKIIDDSQADLVERVIDANRRLIEIRQRLGIHGDAVNIVDTPNLIDETQRSIPLARPSVTYRIYRSLERYSHASMTATKVAITGGVAGLVSVLVGLDRPDWAVVSSLMVLQWGPDRTAGSIRGLHRLVGSVLGIFLYALLFSFGLDSWTLLIALAACQFGAEILVVKNYALTTIVTTPLALLLGGNVSGPLVPLVAGRVAEVSLSVIVALVVLRFWKASTDEKHYLRHIGRCYLQMGTLLGALLTGTPNEALNIRRDLQYELLSERQAIQSLGINHPDTAAKHWEGHRKIRAAGYLMLDYCRTHADTMADREDIAKLAKTVHTAKEYS
nr:FUSC family protein [Corynebacterium lactis]